MKKLLLLIVLAVFAINANAQNWGNRGSTDLSTVRSEISDTITARIGSGAELGDVAVILTDTIPLYGGIIGTGHDADTVAFSVGDVIWGQKIDGSHNIVLTKVSAVAVGTSPDVDIALLYDANYKDATPTTVLTADLTVTSTTAGDDATSFSNATIEPGNWLWIRVDEATSQPTQLVISIFGYKTE